MIQEANEKLNEEDEGPMGKHNVRKEMNELLQIQKDGEQFLAKF
jgi:hypothetical protein